MFSYCGNNPVSYADSLGTAPIDVAIVLLNHWLSGDGDDLFFEEGTVVAEAFKNSPTTQAAIQDELHRYINGEDYGSDNIIYTSSELGLWLAARKSSYVISISERTHYYKSYGLTIEETIYNIDFTLSDNYNFDTIHDTGDGIGSVLNNVAYLAHTVGIGADYYWNVHFKQTVTTKKVLKRMTPDLLK